MNAIDVGETWDRLRAIRELDFEAVCRSPTRTGWIGSGRGIVHVEQLDPATILFHEKGSWTPKNGVELSFSNVYRWTADRDRRLIRLEHLRFGLERPVYLFDLVPLSEHVWESAAPHICRDDRYSALMKYDQGAVRLSWTITGPSKDEKISYSYR